MLSLAQQPHDQGKDDADDDAGCNGEVKTKVFPLDGNIAGQSSQKGYLAPDHKQSAYDNHKNAQAY